jgi:hypothetical protein
MVGAATAAAAAAVLSPASAAGGGTDRQVVSAPLATVNGWTQLSTVTQQNTAEPHAVRRGGGAIVVWPQRDSASSQSIRTRSIGPGGARGSAIGAVVANWDAVTQEPKIITAPGGFLTAFSGLRSGDPSEDYDGPMAFATSPDEFGWVFGEGSSLSKTQLAYASYGMGAVDDGGVPLVAVNAGSTGVVTLHRGIDPNVPAATDDWATTTMGGCCTYYANVARDRVSGEVWAAWWSLRSTSDTTGIFAQKVHPLPVGARAKAPASSEGTSTTDPRQTIALAGRVGGEVWAGYPVGYPTPTGLKLWRLGSSETLNLPARYVRNVVVAPAPAGRLWVAWFQQSPSGFAVKAARTNAAVTRFGAVQTFRPPGGSFGSVWTMTAVGDNGYLDLVINANKTSTGNAQVFHRRIKPALSVSATPSRLADGRVSVKVTDAGAPVANARVTFRGTTKLTSAAGTTTFSVSRSVRDGTYQVTGAKSGFAPGRDTVRVT